VQAPLILLKYQQLKDMTCDLLEEASPLPFKEIYLIGNSDTRSQLYKLK
jgi:hypothetical protein